MITIWGFQCSSASRKFLNQHRGVDQSRPRTRFSALQRAENSSIRRTTRIGLLRSGFSALQRAENSSMRLTYERGEGRIRFQCSSASRKFLNRPAASPSAAPARSFSALQRAENSSILTMLLPAPSARIRFQCSSASRKFLNERGVRWAILDGKFQCSSASRKFLNSNRSNSH